MKKGGGEMVEKHGSNNSFCLRELGGVRRKVKMKR